MPTGFSLQAAYRPCQILVGDLVSVLKALALSFRKILGREGRG